MPERPHKTSRAGLRQGRRILLLVTCTICAGVLVSQARVFFRWKSSDATASALKSLGGRLAYETEVELNGSLGNLQVFGFEQDLASLARDLKQALDLPDFQYDGGTMALARRREGARDLTFVAARIQDQVLVFCLESKSTAGSAELMSRPIARDIPYYPQSEPIFSARDRKAGMSLAVTTVPESPGAVRTFYSSQLASAGWTPPIDTGRKGLTGLNIYRRGTEICCVHVASSPATGTSQITLLHKKRGIK